MKITLHQISKNYSNCCALTDISLDIEEGKLITLLGPSGSGKTTLLKVVAGLESPDLGQVIIDKLNVTNLSPKDRNIGFVFQHYALFKHMRVFDNVAFGLTVKPSKSRPNKIDIAKKVNDLLKLVQLENLHDRYPHELSGGQRQRVALARALAVEPKILLLDEPFAALDAKLKLELRRWLRNLQKQTNITIILVTHDQEEALDIADQVIILNNGKLEQVGTASEVYHQPRTAFVYNFLGHYNIFKATRDSNEKISIISKKEQDDSSSSKWLNPNKIVANIVNLFGIKSKTSQEVKHEYFEVFVRPHDIEISNKPLDDDYIPAIITHINLAGPLVKMELESPDYELIQVEISHEQLENLKLKKDDKIYAKAKQITVFTEV